MLIFAITYLPLFTNNAFAKQSTAEKYYNEAVKYFEEGEYEKVIGASKKAIETNPKYLAAYFAMGRAYTILNKPQEAIAIFQKSLNIDPNDGDSYLGLGVAHRVIGEYQKGIDALKKALEVEPNNANNSGVYVGLAAIYEELKLYNECLLALEKAKILDPDYGDVYAGFGDYYVKIKQIDKAKENYAKAIAIYRKDGLEDLAQKYEKILNKAGKPIVRAYLKSRCVATGKIIDETSEYLKIKGDIFCPGYGDGFIMGQGGENKYNKKDIEHIEEIKE